MYNIEMKRGANLPNRSRKRLSLSLKGGGGMLTGARLKDHGRLVIGSFADFMRDDGPMLAGAISCFFILAFIPFILLMVSVFGYLLGEYNEMHRFLLQLLLDLFPSVTRQITEEVGTVIGNRQIGLVTFIVYGLFSLELFFSVETAVQAMFKAPAKRPFLKSLALSLITVTLLITLTLASFAATWLLQIFEALSKSFPAPKVGWVPGIFTGVIAPMGVVFVVSTLLYFIFPSRRVLTHALLGGLFTTILLEAAKFLFTFYIAWRVFRLGAIYGSLSAIMVFILWTFYASSIFLIGAKLVYNLGISRRKVTE
jgi:membrane protein